MQNEKEKFKENFLENEVVGISIFAAFGRAKIYSPTVKEKDKAKLKQFIKERLKVYRNEYRAGNVSEEKHVLNIQKLADDISTHHKNILSRGRFRIGVAQKLFNLYLKYLWVLGWIQTPLHCPFDSRIISKLGKGVSAGCRKWTATDDIDCYNKWIDAARHIAGENIAEWELRVWNETNKV